MHWRLLHALVARVRTVVRPSKAEHDVDDELSFHVAMQTSANQEAGMSEAEARRRAHVALGGIDQIKERSRDVWPLRWLRDLAQDLRYAQRALRRTPGFTSIVVLTLALGIGANTALFSVISGVLLRPLPFPDPQRLIRVWATVPGRTLRGNLSLPDFREVRNNNRTLDALGAYAFATFNATGGDRPELLPALRVTASLWGVLKVNPLHGRLFSGDAETWGGHHTVVLCYDLWQRRFGGDPRAIGQTLDLDGQAYTVVAVMPRSFAFGGPATQVWTPMAFPPGDIADSRQMFFIELLGRMKRDVTMLQTRADLSLVARDLDRRFNSHFDITTADWQESIVGPTRPTLLLLFGAVGIVLLIACANVANLLLARATTREHELTVRATLGAGRQRLVRQLLAEHLLLAFIGAAGGWGLAWALIRSVPALGPVNVPRLSEVGLDGRIAGFAATLAVVTGVAFGIWPARQAGRVGLVGTLAKSARTVVGGTIRAYARRAFVTAEVALSLVLLVGAALLMVSLYRVQQIDPGFVPEHLFTARLNLPRAQYPSPERVRRAVDQIAEAVAALPGVQAGGITTTLPMTAGDWLRLISIDGRPAPTTFSQVPTARYRVVTPGYVTAMGATLRRGRVFTREDVPGAPLVAVINETMARRLWPDADPIGQRVSVNPPESLVPFLLPLRDGSMRFPRLTVVGILSDFRQDGLEPAAEAEIFVPFAQSDDLTGLAHFVAARTTGDPLTISAAVQEVLRKIDPGLPLANVRSMESRLADSIAQRRMVMLLLSGFAALAVVLAVVGLYGLMAYTVSQRRGELGVRTALGATGADLVRMVMAEGLRMTAIGAVIGLVLAVAVSRVMAAQLFQVEAVDPLVYGGVTLLLVTVAGLACGVPAIRAARTDPASALRAE